jgi:LytS/YehU family sensor histidine kinase
MENARLKAAHLEATNLLLRQQMHPHFLFNALNILKSLYKSDTAAGEEYLLHLVNFLRASLADPETRLTPLAKEMRTCIDYLEMQRIRFDEALDYSLDIPADISANGYVPPFSLQSLLENAIKHNEVTEIAPLHIRVYYENGYLVTSNNLQIRNTPESHASGRGLINLAERYRIISGDELIVQKDHSHFSVGIKILQHEDRHHRG